MIPLHAGHKPVSNIAITNDQVDGNLSRLLKNSNIKSVKSLSANYSDNKARVVFDPDERLPIKNTRAYPWKCICLLQIFRSGSLIGVATGFFIGPRCVITNGHVVFGEGGYVSEIKVIPGHMPNIPSPFGYDISKKFVTTQGWVDHYNDWTVGRNYDYAAVVLSNSSLFDRIGGFLNYADADSLQQLVIAGYPIESEFEVGSLLYAAGSDIGVSDYGYEYIIDTSVGQSGSPILMGSGNTIICVGVHSGGTNINFGVRCNRSVIENWNTWRTF